MFEVISLSTTCIWFQIMPIIGITLVILLIVYKIQPSIKKEVLNKTKKI